MPYELHAEDILRGNIIISKLRKLIRYKSWLEEFKIEAPDQRIFIVDLGDFGKFFGGITIGPFYIIHKDYKKPTIKLRHPEDDGPMLEWRNGAVVNKDNKSERIEVSISQAIVLDDHFNSIAELVYKKNLISEDTLKTDQKFTTI